MSYQVDFDPGAFGLEAAPLWARELDGEQATRALGEALGGALEAGDVLGLVGTLGAGKTTLVQGLCAALGGAHVTSPTYTLINLYEDCEPPVAHVDLYRLERLDDLESIGYWDYLESERLVLCVEWISMLPGAWPGEGAVLVLEHHGGGRRARLWARGRARARLAALASS